MGKWKKSSKELIEHFESSLEGNSQVEKRKMFGYSCFFLKGNMFTGLHEENWILRLSKKDLEEIKKEYRAEHFDPMGGRPMKEYVSLPSQIVNDGTLLQQWLDRSLRYVSTLPLKVRKKRKTK